MKKIIAISLVVIMMLSLSVSALAVDLNGSPDKPGTEHKVETYSTDGGTATHTVNPDGTVTITATTEDGHTFTKWIIEGDYEIVSGSLTDKVIVIIPKSDIIATAYFDGAVKPPVKPWDKEESPETGNYVAIVAAVAVVALFGCAWSVKKAVKD